MTAEQNHCPNEFIFTAARRQTQVLRPMAELALSAGVDRGAPVLGDSAQPTAFKRAAIVPQVLTKPLCLAATMAVATAASQTASEAASVAP